MNRVRLGFLTGILVSLAVAARAVPEATLSTAATSATITATDTVRPRIQLALLLDTSNSMDGLIEQAKAELWHVVNEFATARREGQRPTLEVALYEYGNNSLTRESGFVRRVLPLTNDLDKVSEELFALDTNGGKEYCGAAIQDAISNLAWSTHTHDLKMIFIAGNEPFTQGPTDYGAACRAAIARGVTVNTIFCGPHEEGVTTRWKDGALLADGQYLNIDQNRVARHIDAPQDAEIAQLGEAINVTYVPYGVAGQQGLARQSVQDVNARQTAAGVMVQRAVSKASAYYQNATWDLVDAVQQGQIQLDHLRDEDLPEAMRAMTAEQRKGYIKQLAARRNEIQARIQRLNAERTKYVAAIVREQSATGEETLDSAIVRTVRAQASRKQYTFE